MKRLALGWMLSILVFACSDDPPPVPGTFGASCTTVTDMGSTECDSGVCTDAFDQSGPLCSLECTTSDMCPEGSDGKKCNMRGYCKP